MKKLVQRLIVFFVGLPLVVVIILIPFFNHLAFNLLVTAFGALGAAEFALILGKKNLSIGGAEALVLGLLGPLAMTAEVSFGAPGGTVFAAVIAGASWLLVSRVFSSGEKLNAQSGRTAAGLSVIVYPGLFIMWIVRMAVLSGGELPSDALPGGVWYLPQKSTVVILVFMLTVMINDSVAWAAGMLFGRGNRGIVAVSPNKSVAGFIGGTAASMLAAAAGVFLFGTIFVPALLPPLPSGLIMGFVMGISASLGDLGESALKRSSGVKDSGSIIPGRGGVLDSIDSLALAAPVFYAAYRILFKH
jgi:phosphatidate cytidylyltransferase